MTDSKQQQKQNKAKIFYIVASVAYRDVEKKLHSPQHTTEDQAEQSTSKTTTAAPQKIRAANKKTKKKKTRFI